MRSSSNKLTKPAGVDGATYRNRLARILGHTRENRRKGPMTVQARATLLSAHVRSAPLRPELY